LGNRSVRTSPLCTQLLHEVGNGQHLGAIRVVCFESGDFLGESAAISKTVGSLHERNPNRF
jgi:hypothetical protein